MGTPRGLMEVGRGGACVPARVALQGRIRRSIPRAQCVCFRYGNAAARTFGRARRHRPYGFVWADCTWDGDVVWEDCARMFAPTVSFEQIVHGMVGFLWADCTWTVGFLWADCM